MLTDGLVAATIVEGQVVAMQINDRMRYNGARKVPEASLESARASRAHLH